MINEEIEYYAKYVIPKINKNKISKQKIKCKVKNIEQVAASDLLKEGLSPKFVKRLLNLDNLDISLAQKNLKH